MYNQFNTKECFIEQMSRSKSVFDGCGVIGIIDESGKRFSGNVIIRSIATMRERSNGLGGGFAAYGIYPEFADCYAFHAMYETEQAKKETDQYLEQNFVIERSEPIPTRESKVIKYRPLLWRYFLKIKDEKRKQYYDLTEEDIVVMNVMYVNTKIIDAFIASSGKNMGAFKGVGYPEDIGDFFMLEKYEGYTWTAHGRFPTNSVAWWGGAHPFSLLDWTVVHNGEISSYGINKRYLLNFGYHCTLFTDTEVIAYLFDLLCRKHKLDFDIASKVLCAPLWDDVERMPEKEREFYQALRMTYGSALLNGPFAVIVGHSKGMVGINDRIKLRPLVAARKDSMLFISSEESAIREICPDPEIVWMPRAGEPVIGMLKP